MDKEKVKLKVCGNRKTFTPADHKGQTACWWRQYLSFPLSDWYARYKEECEKSAATIPGEVFGISFQFD
jgi:hypothetical protein